MSIKRSTVFCGSSSGSHPVYAEDAFLLGKTLALQGVELVYGGCHLGLMGSVANGALSAGGKVIGVMPNFLKEKEIAHRQLTELIWVETMHERKSRMNELSDGVIALAGGFGTLEEFFEMLTWGQLGLHKNPIGLLNTNGFYDHLLGMVETMVTSGFLKEVNRQMMLVNDDIEALLERMRNYVAPVAGKWITKQTT